MRLGLIFALGFLVTLTVLTIVKWIWFFRLRHRFDSTPVTLRWLNDHDYRKDGDDRQTK